MFYVLELPEEDYFFIPFAGCYYLPFSVEDTLPFDCGMLGVRASAFTRCCPLELIPPSLLREGGSSVQCEVYFAKVRLYVLSAIGSR